MHCPICCSENTVDFSSSCGRDLIICSDCRHVTWKELPTEQELVDYYTQAYTNEHEQKEIQISNTDYYLGHFQELANFAEKPIADLVIADVGCSYPIFLEQGLKSGCRGAIGVDWSSEAHEYGEKIGLRMFTPAQFLESVPDESLDVLRYSHTLEHMIDPLSALMSQIAKLRNGGLLYITQPNIPIYRAEKLDVQVIDSVFPRHLHFFTPLSLKILQESVGVKPFKFFTVGNEIEAESRDRFNVDYSYGVRKLFDLAELCEPCRGALNCYPAFSGENSGAYGFKSRPEPKVRLDLSDFCETKA